MRGLPRVGVVVAVPIANHGVLVVAPCSGDTCDMMHFESHQDRGNLVDKPFHADVFMKSDLPRSVKPLNVLMSGMTVERRFELGCCQVDTGCHLDSHTRPSLMHYIEIVDTGGSARDIKPLDARIQKEAKRAHCDFLSKVRWTDRQVAAIYTQRWGILHSRMLLASSGDSVQIAAPLGVDVAFELHVTEAWFPSPLQFADNNPPVVRGAPEVDPG